MKLPDFLEDAALEALRARMRAPLVPWEPWRWEGVVIDDLLERLGSSEGVELGEDLSELRVLDDGTFAYKGHRVLVYIRDQYYAPEGSGREYKFHLAKCSTITSMFESGRRNRYVVTTNTSGRFKVRLTDRSGRYVHFEGEREMQVCKNCLTSLDYRGYNGAGWAKGRIYNEFSINAFFDAYGGTRIDERPDHDEHTAPINAYPDDWGAISAAYRARVGWVCEECELDLSGDRHWLHVHHKNHLKNDVRRENLIALCLGCHTEKSDHHSMKANPQFRYAEFVRKYPGWGKPRPR